MSPRALRLVVPAAAIGAAVAMLAVSSREPGWSDYGSEAEPAFNAIARGDVQGFLDRSPAYVGSMILRAPLVWASAQLGIGLDGRFRVGASLGIAALVVIAIVLARRMLATGRGAAPTLTVAVLAAGAPLGGLAIGFGHPEEVMAAAGAVGAVLLAEARAPVTAGVVLGLAIASKQWAVLAIAPVLATLPERRVVSLALAGVVACALYAPALLGEQVLAVQRGASQAKGIAFSQELWWPLTEAIAGPKGARSVPGWLAPLIRPLIVAMSVPLTLVWVRRRPPRGAEADALGLLALLLIARCALDPWNVHYYHGAAALALLAWEVVRGARWPVGTLVFVGAVYATTYTVGGRHSDFGFALYAGWLLPFTAYLGARLYGINLPATRRAAPAPA